MLYEYLFRLRHSRAARNAGSSYFALVSTTFTGLLSIPLAVHFLTAEELGLWAVITVFSGYLSQLELGIGASTGRMMADSIVKQDKLEIDRWWTLTRIILSLLGAAIVVVGLAITPIFLTQMANDYSNRNEAMTLFATMVLIQGIKMPFQGVEGILIAQERFHWIPLRQSLIFWVELAVIAGCLFAGLKLYAMIWGQVATVLVAWSSNWFLLSKSKPNLDWNFTGLDRQRIRKIFGFSLNISGLSFVQVVTRSIPVVLLGKFGGLGLVPIYTLTNKSATVLVTIGLRMYQSFYPNLQKLFIAGDLDGFQRKVPKVGILTIASSLAVAGFLLCFNRMAVGVLAKPEFFAGIITTMWFAVAVITIPLCAFLQMPLLVAGRMGKSVLAAVLPLLVGISISAWAYRSYGMTGLAGVSALLPLVLCAYGYVRSAAECSCRPWVLFGPVILAALGAITTVLFSGLGLESFPYGEHSFSLFGKQVPFPSVPELTIGGGVILLATCLFIAGIRSMRSNHAPAAPVCS